LRREFETAVGVVNAINLATKIRKAAELMALSEQRRAKALRGEEVDLGELIKLEGEARRAVQALNIEPQSIPRVPMRERLALMRQNQQEVK
jgi:hypothetical protein